MKMPKILFFSLAFALLAACSPKPEPIEFGKDQCAFCRMTISDPKFGAELVTPKGRVLKYDALECMIDDLDEKQLEYAMLLAVPFDQPKELVDVESLHFVYSPMIKSPMGANLGAFASRDNIPESERKNAVDWNRTVDLRLNN